MAIDIEKLLLEIYGTVQQIKTEISEIRRELELSYKRLDELESRLTKLERIVYAGLAIAAVLEPIIIKLLGYYLKVHE